MAGKRWAVESQTNSKPICLVFVCVCLHVIHFLLPPHTRPQVKGRAYELSAAAVWCYFFWSKVERAKPHLHTRRFLCMSKLFYFARNFSARVYCKEQQCHCVCFLFMLRVFCLWHFWKGRGNFPIAPFKHLQMSDVSSKQKLANNK